MVYNVVFYYLQTPGNYRAGDYMHLVYSDRMRSAEDRQIMMDIFTRIFVDEEVYIPCGSLTVTLHSVQVKYLIWILDYVN